jgi:hypothetical protein
MLVRTNYKFAELKINSNKDINFCALFLCILILNSKRWAAKGTTLMEVFATPQATGLDLGGGFVTGTVFKSKPATSIGHWPYYYHRQLR